MLDGQLREGDLAAQDVEHPVQIVPVDDRAGVPPSLDREVAPDVEVAFRGGVLAGAGDREPNVPLGRRIVSAPGWALAAMIADRSEIWPGESFPFWRFTATVSSTVLTAKTAGVCRTSSGSSPGRNRVCREPRRDRAFSIDRLVPPDCAFFITSPPVAIECRMKRR